MRIKAQLVVKDYSQRECIDCNEAFSTIVKESSIVASFGLDLKQFYAKITNLHGEL